VEGIADRKGQGMSANLFESDNTRFEAADP
jgi:hypothetical protein